MKAQGFLRGLGRAWLCAILTTSALLALWCASASAISFDTSTDTSVTLDADSHWWSNGARAQTSGDYQFITNWDAVDAEGIVYLEVTRRNIRTGARELYRFDRAPIQELRNYEDAHNVVALGLSPIDGRVHISYSNHAISGHYYNHYGISNERCMTEATFRNCTFTWENHAANEAAEREWSYPLFFNDQNGNLFLTGRYKGAGNGDQYLFRYGNNARWTDLGAIINGTTSVEYDVDGIGRGIEASRTRNPYMFGWQFDKNNRLHVMWGFREMVGRNAGLENQHDVYYAYSDDLGVNWKDGVTRRREAREEKEFEVIGISGSNPITVRETSAIAASFPPGYYPYTQAPSMALDSNNQPHLIVNTALTQSLEDVEAALFCQTHVWRTENSRGEVVWYSGYAQPTNECAPLYQEWGSPMFDPADDMSIIYGRQKDFGWRPYNRSVGSVPYPNLHPANVTAQGGVMQIVPTSSLTAVDSVGEAGIAIERAARANREIEIRIRNTTESTSGVINFITATDRTWAGWESRKTKTFTVPNDGRYNTITVSMERVEGWRGTLRALELFPADRGTRGQIDIDYIRIQDERRNVAKAWEFTIGKQIYAGEATPGRNWSTWSTELLLSEVNDTVEDMPFPIDVQRYADSRRVDFTAVEQGATGTESLVLHEFDITGDDIIKNWGFDVNDMLWTAVNQVEGYAWASDSGTGTLSGRLTGSDPYLHSATNLKVPISTNRYIHIRMKNSTAATTAKFYFITDASRTYAEARSKSFTITARSGYTWYHVSMERVRDWEGSTLYQLRLDPTEDATREGSFNIDRIYIDNSPR